MVREKPPKIIQSYFQRLFTGRQKLAIFRVSKCPHISIYIQFSYRKPYNSFTITYNQFTQSHIIDHKHNAKFIRNLDHSFQHKHIILSTTSYWRTCGSYTSGGKKIVHEVRTKVSYNDLCSINLGS
jgi:hypothetical protein